MVLASTFVSFAFPGRGICYKDSWVYIEKARSLKEEFIEQRFIDDLVWKLPYDEFKQFKE